MIFCDTTIVKKQPRHGVTGNRLAFDRKVAGLSHGDDEL